MRRGHVFAGAYCGFISSENILSKRNFSLIFLEIFRRINFIDVCALVKSRSRLILFSRVSNPTCAHKESRIKRLFAFLGTVRESIKQCG